MARTNGLAGWLPAWLVGKTHTLHTAVPINLFYDFTRRARPTKDKRPNASQGKFACSRQHKLAAQMALKCFPTPWTSSWQ